MSASRAPADFAAQLERIRLPARLAYVGVLLLATLSSLDLDLDAAAVAARAERMLRLRLSRMDVVDGIRNLVLFAGWGLLWMVTAPPGRSWARIRGAVLTGAAMSLFVECVQLLSETRVSSVVDVGTNTAGALVGALVLAVVVRALAQSTGGRSFVGLPAAVFALSYGLVTAAEAFVPLFRQTSRVVMRGDPFTRFAAAIGDVRWSDLLQPPLMELVLFLPAGAFAVAALHEAGRPYPAAARGGALATCVLFVLAEVAHGAMGIRIHPGAAAVHVAAAALGAWMARAWLPGFSRTFRGADRPRLLFLLYAGVLALWALRPYAVETRPDAIVAQLSTEWWIPLRSLGLRVDVFSVVDVLVSFCLYVPLGALLAVWPLRARGWLGGVTPAVLLATALEISQLVVVSRTLDVTDLMIQSAGAAVGWVVVRRAGFPVHGAQLPAGLSARGSRR